MLATLDHLLSTLARPWLAALLLLLIAVIGALDYLTGFRLSFAIFYFVPIAVATWYVGERAGALTAFLSFFLSASAGLINAIDAADMQLIVLWNALTPLLLFLVIVALLHKLKMRLQQEQRLARTDHLTGCLNAHAFMPLLQYHFDLAARDGQPVTLAYIDLDDFKSINDTHGHDEGDRVLKLVARVWLESCRRTDLVARLGGDEFCVLLPNTDQSGAASIIAKARNALLAAFRSEHMNVTCSIGAVTFPGETLDTRRAIKAADMLMYRAKNQGKNSTVFSLFVPGQDGDDPSAASAYPRRSQPQISDP